MNASVGGFEAQRTDHPLDLAPTAEMDHISEITAAAGAGSRFRNGMVAEMRDQLRRLGENEAPGRVNIVTQSTPRLMLLVTRP